MDLFAAFIAWLIISAVEIIVAGWAVMGVFSVLASQHYISHGLGFGPSIVIGVWLAILFIFTGAAQKARASA